MLKRQGRATVQPVPVTRMIDPGSDIITLSDIRDFLFRYWLVILLSTVVAMGAAGFYVWVKVPIYTAQALLLIEPSKSQIHTTSGTDGTISLDTAYVDGQIELMRSEIITSKVIEKFGLKADPEFTGTEPLKDYEKSRFVTYALIRKLDIRRVGVSYAIRIAFQSFDPEKAAQIANFIGEAYVRERMATKASAARLNSVWLEKRLDQLRRQMNDATQALQEFRARQDFRLLSEKRRRSAQQGGTEPVTLVEIESRAQTYKKMYESYYQAFTESVQRQSYPVSNARIITMATRPLSPSHPRKKLILAIGFLGGALFGITLALLRELTDPRVRSERQILEQASMPVLTRLPAIKAPQVNRAKLRKSRESDASDYLVVPSVPAQYRAALHQPFSEFGIGLKYVKAHILHMHEHKSTCLGVAAPQLSPTKTTIAANIANHLASSVQKTLLLDADCTKTELSQILAPQAEAGLFEVLRQECTASSVILRGKPGYPDVLPMVTGSDWQAECELLASEMMQETLETLMERYNLIIVNLPPLLQVVDGLSLCAMLDGTIVVAQWGKTRIETLKETRQALTASRAELIGALLVKGWESLKVKMQDRTMPPPVVASKSQVGGATHWRWPYCLTYRHAPKKICAGASNARGHSLRRISSAQRTRTSKPFYTASLRMRAPTELATKDRQDRAWHLKPH